MAQAPWRGDRARPVIVAALAAAVSLAAAGEARGWGASGHRIIGTLAAQSLPEEIPAFLRTPEAVWELGELGREADRSKGAGSPHDPDLDPGHYVFLGDDQTAAGVPLDPLPPTREAFDTALRAKGSDQYRVGYLPYAIIEGWQQLVQDFAYWRTDRAGEQNAAEAADRDWFARDRRLRETLTLRDLGYWSHFVGDASQPLQVSIHSNGWGDLPNPREYSTAKDLRYQLQSRFVRDYITTEDVAAKLKPPADCGGCSIETRTVRYLREGQAQIIPLYELEKRHAFDGTDPAGKDFAAARLAAGAAELRDMIVDAWRASADGKVGYPPVTVRDVEAGKAMPIAELKGRD